MARELEPPIWEQGAFDFEFQREPCSKMFVSRIACSWKVHVLFIDQSTIKLPKQCVV